MRWLVILTVVLAPIAAQERSTLDRMKCLSLEFLAIEKALAKGVTPAESKDCAGVVRDLTELPVPPRVKARKLEEEFHRLAKAAAEVAQDLSGHLADEDTGQAKHLLEHLRAACITCHVSIRTRDRKRGEFPATENTVWGRVEVQDLAGETRDTASGVVIFLDRVERGDQPFRPAHIVPRVSQRKQRFTPRILPIVTGTSVEFPNDDRVFHNVFSRSKTNPFDLGVYGKGKTRKVVFRKTGLVRLHCNIHRNMVATVLVLGNPFFAVTDEKGLYVITGIPDGEYTVRTWHEFGGSASGKLVVRDGDVVAKDFRIRETKKLVPHKNKFGKPYRERY